MIGEPHRSQYLQAMGLTTWVSRYRLPNAASTEQVAWPVVEKRPPPLPAQRLHALLDEVKAAPAPTSTVAPAPVMTAPRQVKRARALLETGDLPDGMESAENAGAGDEVTQQAPEVQSVAETEAQEPLRFSVQIAALEGRWLIFMPGQAVPDPGAQRLLANLLRAAQVVPDGGLDFHAFDWPMLEELPVEAPLGEAQEGLRAYVAGRHRGWRPEQLLLFGEHPVLNSVLGLDEGRCALLNIPAWQGPSLDELGRSASAKRELWSVLVEWRAAWQGAVNDGAASATR